MIHGIIVGELDAYPELLAELEAFCPSWEHAREHLRWEFEHQSLPLEDLVEATDCYLTGYKMEVASEFIRRAIAPEPGL